MSETPCLIEALRLRAKKVSCVPIPPTGMKFPQGTGWKQFQERLPTEQELRASLGNGENGLAIIGGAVSGGYEIMDFDDAGALERFRDLAREAGLLPLVKRLVRQMTPDHGCHLGYRCSEPVPGNHHLARRFSAELNRAAALIETRGQGGLWLIHPSPPGCHPSGRPYRLVSGDWAAPPVITTEERTALHELARGLNEYVSASEVVSGPKPTRTAAGARPGDAFNARGDVAALLLRHGWTLAGPQGQGTRWRRPGKDFGHSATLDVVAPGVFYVFSSSTLFDAPRAYDAFGVYTLLEHGGDYATAARQLSAEGYGDPAPPPARRMARAALRDVFRLPGTAEPAGSSTWEAQLAAFRFAETAAPGAPTLLPAAAGDPDADRQPPPAAAGPQALAAANADLVTASATWAAAEIAGDPDAEARAEAHFYAAERRLWALDGRTPPPAEGGNQK